MVIAKFGQGPPTSEKGQGRLIILYYIYPDLNDMQLNHLTLQLVTNQMLLILLL